MSLRDLGVCRAAFIESQYAWYAIATAAGSVPLLARMMSASPFANPFTSLGCFLLGLSRLLVVAAGLPERHCPWYRLGEESTTWGQAPPHAWDSVRILNRRVTGLDLLRGGQAGGSLYTERSITISVNVLRERIRHGRY